MSNNEFQEMPGINDERKVIVAGRRYYGMTDADCPTCNSPDHVRKMYLKLKHGNSLTLECPVCDQVSHVPSGTVRLVE